MIHLRVQVFVILSINIRCLHSYAQPPLYKSPKTNYNATIRS